MNISPSMMASMVTTRMYKPAFKWILGDNPTSIYPVSFESELMYKTVLYYEVSSLLTVHTNLAVLEAQNHPGNSSFWRALYEPMESVKKHYATPGIMYDNILLSIRQMAGTTTRPTSGTKPPQRIWAASWT